MRMWLSNNPTSVVQPDGRKPNIKAQIPLIKFVIVTWMGVVNQLVSLHFLNTFRALLRSTVVMPALEGRRRYFYDFFLTRILQLENKNLQCSVAATFIKLSKSIIRFIHEKSMRLQLLTYELFQKKIPELPFSKFVFCLYVWLQWFTTLCSRF